MVTWTGFGVLRKTRNIVASIAIPHDVQLTLLEPVARQSTVCKNEPILYKNVDSARLYMIRPSPQLAYTSRKTFSKQFRLIV